MVASRTNTPRPASADQPFHVGLRPTRYEHRGLLQDGYDDFYTPQGVNVTMNPRLVSLVLVMLGCLTTVSAHGGETSESVEVGLTAGQTLLFSLVGGLAAMQATSVLFNIRSANISPVMVGLATYTGLIHLLLGLDDTLLLVGGVGVIGLLVALVVVELPVQRERLAMLGLCGVTVAMFVGYFVSNHDPHMIFEDRLGLTAKLSELVLLGLLIRALRSPTEA